MLNFKNILKNFLLIFLPCETLTVDIMSRVEMLQSDWYRNFLCGTRATVFNCILCPLIIIIMNRL